MILLLILFLQTTQIQLSERPEDPATLEQVQENPRKIYYGKLITGIHSRHFPNSSSDYLPRSQRSHEISRVKVRGRYIYGDIRFYDKELQKNKYIPIRRENSRGEILGWDIILVK